MACSTSGTTRRRPVPAPHGRPATAPEKVDYRGQEFEVGAQAAAGVCGLAHAHLRPMARALHEARSCCAHRLTRSCIIAMVLAFLPAEGRISFACRTARCCGTFAAAQPPERRRALPSAPPGASSKHEPSKPAPASRSAWMPSGGSAIISSTQPSAATSGAEMRMASAASCLCAASRHMMAAQDSGVMTK